MTQRALVTYTADIHGGSPFALSPVRWLLQSGHEYRPNPLQELIIEHYVTCWQRVRELRKRARLISIYAGDMTEGLHHGTTQIITPRLDEQESMATAIIESGLTIAKYKPSAGDVVRFVTGTPAHDGEGAQSLERIARSVLDVDANDGARCVSDTLQFKVNGVEFAVMHKPGSGPGSRTHTFGNAYTAWLKSVYQAGLEAGHWPRYVVSAHHHQFLRRDVYALDGHVAMTGVSLPAWKVKDAFVYSVAPLGVAQVGMVVFDVDTDGGVKEHDWRIPIEQGAIEEL